MWNKINSAAISIIRNATRCSHTTRIWQEKKNWKYESSNVVSKVEYDPKQMMSIDYLCAI